jgi:class 3 adenylate cyclase
MAKLDAKGRTGLRDSDFAHVDARGRRRLPINDEAHVRNALARFNQVMFEDASARDRARTRLLKAAGRYGIVPVGFIEGQIRAHGPAGLPTGEVTLLMTDVVDSTGMLARMGDAYAPMLASLRRLLRSVVRRAGGREVDARGDEYFAVFKQPDAAVAAAVALQRAIADHAWPDGGRPRIRLGLHSGRPTLTESGYVGLAVHAVKRICSVAQGDEIVVSRTVRGALAERTLAGVAFVEMGEHRLRGLPERVLLFRLTAASG